MCSKHQIFQSYITPGMVYSLIFPFIMPAGLAAIFFFHQIFTNPKSDLIKTKKKQRKNKTKKKQPKPISALISQTSDYWEKLNWSRVKVDAMEVFGFMLN